MVDALADEYGFELRRCLTGFKYIGDIITALADAGEADRFIFGFEESYGYLSGDHVRDKDAVSTSLRSARWPSTTSARARTWRMRCTSCTRSMATITTRRFR